MENTGISIGVSVFSLNKILIKFCQEEGFPIKGEKGEQKIRKTKKRNENLYLQSSY